MRRDPVAGQGFRVVKVVIEADGGSRGNPGPAGYGAVVFTADRATVLAESKQAIGHATNNVAEYRGLIAGLEDAVKLDATEVAVFMDSKLVVEQMSGRWKVKHPDLIELHAQARKLAARFDRISYAWIPRERNKHADRLANEAMDAAAEISDENSESAVANRRKPRPRKLLQRNPCRRPAGPVLAARRPGYCCCATGRPSYRCIAAIRGAATRSSPTWDASRPKPRRGIWPSAAASPRWFPRHCNGPTTPRRQPPRRWVWTSPWTTT